MLRFAAACIFAMFASHSIAAPFTFDDVENWTGTGAKRAAMVVDWVDDDAKPPALVWGFRWDGTATGYDMLLAIVTADDRLFAKLGDFFGTPVVYGFGYDTDADGEFGVLKIDLSGEPIETVFDEAGIAFSEIPDQDHIRASATDAGDYYAEGWRTYFWHYGNESPGPGGVPTNPFGGGGWVDDVVGMQGRPLEDGSWDSWAYEMVPTQPPFVFTAYAENPSAAASPYPPGDFNRDMVVDDADYVFWKNDFGSTVDLAADANHNGIVDAADYTVWRNHLGSGGGASATTGFGVPEPQSFRLVVCSLCVLWLFLDSRRKVKLS
jgi:hypothetical protein